MFRKAILITVIIFIWQCVTLAQVKIRLFSGRNTGSILFKVIKGRYRLVDFKGDTSVLDAGHLLLLTRFGGKVSVKKLEEKGWLCDSVSFEGVTGKDSFTLRINGNDPLRQNYTGSLECKSDLGTLLLVNDCDIETYVAGVVKAEGGSGKFPEYFKAQAVIARTFMYRNFKKHTSDGYNLCDNTHCQAYNGTASDSLINLAAAETNGQVILGPDTALIISAFHSNCGGETSPSEFVWVTSQPYLRKVNDPYCRSSQDATWQKSFSLDAWIACLKKNGFTGNITDINDFNYSQPDRTTDYHAGAFSVPLRQIRSDLNLRSTFFSVKVTGDSVILSGRGYGHGVGLCQEGAMTMASKGFGYRQIIDFYYTGVTVTDIKNAVDRSDAQSIKQGPAEDKDQHYK
ncbi:MAG: SpoIID/LytB domain-containing protein [Bacteroidales bacterium]